MITHLFNRKEYEQFLLSLPGAHIVHQWGDSSVGKIASKMFATHGFWDGAHVPQISFKCSDISFSMLPELEGVTKAKYLARAKWVSASQGCELSDDDLRAYIIESHRLVATKLTRVERAELGLTGDQYSTP